MSNKITFTKLNPKTGLIEIKRTKSRQLAAVLEKAGWNHETSGGDRKPAQQPPQEPQAPAAEAQTGAAAPAGAASPRSRSANRRSSPRSGTGRKNARKKGEVSNPQPPKGKAHG